MTIESRRFGERNRTMMGSLAGFGLGVALRCCLEDKNSLLSDEQESLCAYLYAC